LLLAALSPSHSQAQPAARAAGLPDLPAPTYPQKDAMIALYYATDGANWTHNEGWLTDPNMCNWYGVGSCWSVGNEQRIISLDLSDNNLKGTLPTQLGDLVDLEILWLGRNQLSGPIPESIGNARKLEQLHLENNRLSGPLPASLVNLTNLEELRLYSNQLSGPIPPALGNLGKLRELNLGTNSFEGSIPAELGRLANLTSLGLGYNRLSGNIPSDLTRLSRLWSLTLSGNDLEGQIPTGLGNLTQLGWLGLDANELTGGIPDGISNLTQLRFLGLSRNRLEGTVPAGLGNLTNLTNLYLGRNAGLTGPLPQDLVAARNMYQFTYDNTNLCMPNNDEFRSWLQGVKGRGGVTTNWQICGIEPHLSFSTPNALAGDVVLLHARLVDDELGRIRGSNQVSATVTGVEGSLQLGDNGTDGDLLGLDGHYSRWLTVMGADTIQAILHYKGWPVISTTVSLIADPQLIALTDLRRLDGEFTKWGTVPGEDLDGNDAADFYDLLDRAWRYAEKYRGIVYDLGHTITRERGFMDDYDLLDPSPDAAESRMAASPLNTPTAWRPFSTSMSSPWSRTRRPMPSPCTASAIVRSTSGKTGSPG
jgi:hypothetical protein